MEATRLHLRQVEGEDALAGLTKAETLFEAATTLIVLIMGCGRLLEQKHANKGQASFVSAWPPTSK